MPIKQVFDTQDAVPEFLKSAVVEVDGKWVFEAESAQEVAGLKSALQKEREEKANLAKLTKQFEGIDAAKAKQLLADAQKAEEEKAKAQGDWENWKQQMQNQFDTEKKALSDQVTGLERDLAEQLITATAMSAINAAKGVSALLLPHVNARVVVENGRREVRIFDPAGNVRYGKDGKPMTIEERVAEMKSDEIFGRAFEASGAGGSGAQAPNKVSAGQKALSRAAFDQMGPVEKMAFIKDGGKITE